MDSDNFLEHIKLQALEPLEPLKPLDLSNLSKQKLTKSLNVKDSKDLSVSKKELLSPINVFGTSKDLQDGTEQSSEFNSERTKSNKSPKIFYGSLDGRINPLHYKTRDMCKDYNSLMNKLYPKEISKEEICEENIQENFEEKELNEKGLHEKDFSYDEDPSKICNPKSNSNIQNETLTKLEKHCYEMEMKHTIEETIFTSLEPKAKDYELDDAIIELLPYSKKKCVVWWEGSTIAYSKFRENCDNIIFFVGEDAYGYSKQNLYEEYIKSTQGVNNSVKSKHGNLSRVYFDLDLNWEDGEILWIPMSQILRILEFSHPLYELQKTKFSTKVWNAVPVKLQK